MTSWKKTALSGAVACTMLGFVAEVTSAPDVMVLTFTNGTGAPAIAGACSAISWTAGNEFRMCSPANILGGGAPLQKDTIIGGETYTFSNASGSFVLTGVTGTPGNPGASFLGSAAPGANTNVWSWQQPALFFGPAFNFLAPYSGSLAGTAYGPAAYQLPGPPYNGSLVAFIKAPVMEAQWGGTWFPLGQASGGVTFYANITLANTIGNVTTFTFEMFANELIDAAEDPGSAGFTGWTAEWHQQGTGSYVDTTPPIVSSTVPADTAINVSTSLANIVVNYNEPMATTLVLGPITVDHGVTVGNPTWSNNDMTASFPITSGALVTSTVYKVTFHAGPTDKSGNPVTLPIPFSFTVGAPDTTCPTVSSVNVSSNGAVTVIFDENIDTSTVNIYTFTVTPSGGTPIDGKVNSISATTFTFTPTSLLTPSTTYTVNIGSVAGPSGPSPACTKNTPATVLDASGNDLLTTSNTNWSFTTAAAGTTGTPVLESNGKGNGLLAGCTMSPRAKFDPSLLVMLLGSFGFLIWRRRRNH